MSTNYRFRGAIEPRPGIRASVLEPETVGTVATLRLYDPIDSWGGDFGISAKEFAAALAGLPEDTSEIRLHINSPGGEVWEAIAILNQLRQHKARVVAVVDGLAASAASFIAAGADETIMGRNTTCMVHDAWGIAIGNANDLHETADILDIISNNIAVIYAEKAEGTVEEWRTVMLAETWFTAEEAVKAGLADKIDTTQTVVKNTFDLTVFAHAGRDNAPDPTTILPRRTLAPAARMQGTLKPPAEPAESINPQEKGTAMADLIQGLRERLGISADAELDDDGILNAVDAALTARPESFTPPEGTVLMDATQLTDLQAAAEQGRLARQEQIRAEREQLVSAAIADGRIPPARKDHWIAELNADDEGARAVLASLAPNTIPVTPMGYTGGEEASTEDHLYAKAWGTTTDKEA